MGNAERFKTWALVISAFSVGIANVAIGCGSDSFTAALSTDGGSGDADVGDAGSPTDASNDQSVGCIAAPKAPPNEEAFCAAFASISSRCLACESCRQENASACATFGDQLSDAFRSAIVACADEIDCLAFEQQGPLAQDPCIASRLFDAGPTAAQLAAQSAYCDRCADAGGNGAQSCANYFGQPDAAGIGTLMLFASDSVANDTAAGCPYCDGLFYPGCEIGKLCNGVPKDQCKTGLCK